MNPNIILVLHMKTTRVVAGLEFKAFKRCEGEKKGFIYNLYTVFVRHKPLNQTKSV